jgi:uncharacterized protein with GYD domain
MPTYYVLVRYTKQGRQTVTEAQHRIQANWRQAQAAGLTVLSLHLTLGKYNYIGLVDAPDDESLASFLLGLQQGGVVRATSLRAFGMTEAKRILQEIPKRDA